MSTKFTPFPKATVEIRPSDRAHPILHCSGELDAACSEEFAAALDDLLAGYPDSLELDLSGLEFIDSHVLALIVEAMRRLDTRGAYLTLTAEKQPLRLLELTGISRRARVHPPNPGASSALDAA
jgi:anti-anti-sigma factor